MKDKIREEFKEELDILKSQVEPEELFVLGYLKGFTRTDLKMMVNQK